MKPGCEQVAAIGPEIAASLVSYFSEEHNRGVIRELFDRGFTIDVPRLLPQPASLAGKIFVFTGGLEDLTREQAGQLVEEHGGPGRSPV